ncbi:helix-turn-helix domain-containing protein [Geomicrobium sediminis]|uniref:DNA-binding Xre family transcriptional regulator n=1 Tax=Geomicrobium sediminis TaxID=1347788 RepID=A0ABS2PI47_9BACL|nr:helix-turn-helix transcriptional regulator [Geomicrobium sediminis]MBM7634932.1 DNA-binding Xre family transcriptional regulator [Geomicrobium sediminis]
MARVTNNLKRLIEEKGMNQKEFAKKADIREATVSAMCKNEIKRIPLDVLESIVDVLEIEDMNKLFNIEA